MDRTALAAEIARQAAVGRLPSRDAWTAVDRLLRPGAAERPLGDLIEALLAQDDPEIRALLEPLRQVRRKEILRVRRLRAAGQALPADLRAVLADLPLGALDGWAGGPDALNAFERAVALAGQIGFKRTAKAFAASPDVTDSLRVEALAALGEGQSVLTAFRERLESRRQEMRDAALKALQPGAELPVEVDEDVLFERLPAAFEAASSREEKRSLLDLACCWPTDAAAGAIAAVAVDSWARERAGLILLLRFGDAALGEWDAWLRSCTELRARRLSALRSAVLRAPAEALYVDAAGRGDDPALESELGARAGLARRPAPPPPTKAPVAFVGEVRRPPPAPAPPPVRPSPPPEPSLWEAHVRPFLASNGYLVAGVAMVVVGSSLLAYYTWDKHWLLRYTLMPALLGTFTAALAAAGSWIQRRDAQLRPTAAVLRGAAVGLLPVNFMAVALLARDPQVTARGPAVVLLGGLYLLLAGWGLRRWCGAVHPSLGGLLGGALLGLNALVMVAPAAETLAPAAAVRLPVVAAVGFYAGFALLALAALRFARLRIEDPAVLGFFGATLGITYLQVFAWVHVTLARLPSPEVYAALVVLAGGLVLHLERGRDDGRPRPESFLGFALVLLGLLMGAGDPDVRIAVLLLAGAVWLYQAPRRRHPAHAWIGLSLLVLGVVSVGLRQGVPPAIAPMLGLAAAAGLGALTLRATDDLRAAARGLQAVVALLTVPAAALVQHFQGTPPFATAAVLAGVAALLAVRGARDGEPRWIQTALIVLATALPYAGCVDLAGRTLRGNTLVFGLAALSIAWILLVHLRPAPVLLHARSGVLWIYGVLATAAFLVRVAVERRVPDGAVALRDVLDLGGPVLTAGVMAYAAYVSRSLLPGALAVTIAAVLLPEMRSELRAIFPQLRWGSGFGTALAATALALLAFPLRRSAWLRDLGPGDRYLGRHDFPLRRLDHTLLTWPCVAGAVFLAVKVLTWNVLRNLEPDGLPLRTASAVAIAGAAWALLAVYLRDPRLTVLACGSVIAALALGFRPAFPEAPWTAAVLAGGVFFRTAWAAFRREPVLSTPVRELLRYGSLGAASAAGLALLDAPRGPWTWALAAFAAAELAGHALADRSRLHGAALFGLLVLALLENASGPSVAPLAALVLAVALAHLGLEFRPALHERLRPIADPFRQGAAIMAGLLAVVVAADRVMDRHLPAGTVAAAVLAVAAAARMNASGPLALGAACMGWVALQPADRLFEAARLGVFAAALAGLGAAGVRLPRRVVAGPFAPGRLPALPWILGPALAAATAAVLLHVLRPLEAAQLAGPYLAAGAFAAAALARPHALFRGGAALALAVANVQAVRASTGPWLLDRGLSEVHLIVLGVAATLLQGLALRRFLGTELRRGGLVGAAAILALLAGNYVAHPALAEVTALRFLVSGAAALLAALFFRRASRTWAPGVEPLYHAGVTLAFWCFALAVPALRHPTFALAALLAAVLYFWLRAELQPGPYRASAAVVAFLVLALYAARPILQGVVFPDVGFDLRYYHRNSPVVFALSLVLLRLHGLGGTPWLAFYGGLALMLSTHFAVTALPGLSPFVHPVAGAWAAVLLGHFWTVASAQRSPLRTAVQEWAGLDDDRWASLRASWGLALASACELSVLWGVLDHVQSPKAVGPLLLGGASLLLHQGLLRRSAAWLAVGGAQAVAALHAGFVLESWLPREHVVWVLLGLWAALLAVRAVPWPLFAAVVFAHVLWHHPASSVGLGAFAAGAVLSAASPGARGAPLLLGVPAWLAFFSQAPLREQGWPAAFGTWPLLATAAAVLAAGWPAPFARGRSTADPRLLDALLAWLRANGDAVRLGALGVATALAAFVTAPHLGRAFEERELVLLLVLQAALAAAWFAEGARRESTAAFVLAETAVLGLALAARTQLAHATALWRPEYDVWATLGAFILLGGAQAALDRPGLRRPLAGTLLLLPAGALALTLARGLGTDVLLIVLGLEATMFSFLGRDRRDSPYHAAATAGAVAFVMVLFWSKLELRVLHAYVIPAGAGVLVLLQLFGRRMDPAARNAVRTAALLGMLGSAGFSALADDRHPLAFNLTLVAVGLAAMGLGSLLRIRVYVLLGFAAVMVDLASILVKGLGTLDRSARMTALGVGVLVVGGLLVFGAAWAKLHRDEVEATLARLRARLGAWE